MYTWKFLQDETPGASHVLQGLKSVVKYFRSYKKNLLHYFPNT